MIGISAVASFSYGQETRPSCPTEMFVSRDRLGFLAACDCDAVNLGEYVESAAIMIDCDCTEVSVPTYM